MKIVAVTSESINPLPGSAPVASRASRYSGVAMALHWLIAVLVLSTIPIGWFSTATQGAAAKPGAGSPIGAASQAVPSASNVTGAAKPPNLQNLPNVPTGAAARPAPPPPKTAAQQAAINLHKTVGIVILCLTVLRVGWRLTHQPPALPGSMARPLRWLARASHALFYVLLLVMPLSGWWMSSAVPDPRRHAFGFGFFDIPFLPVTQSWAAAGQMKFVHTNLVWLMVGLAVLHICAALKHHLVDKDDVLKRMLPQRA